MTYNMSFGCFAARKPMTSGGKRSSEVTSDLLRSVSSYNFFKWVSTVIGRHCDTVVGWLFLGTNVSVDRLSSELSLPETAEF